MLSDFCLGILYLLISKMWHVATGLRKLGRVPTSMEIKPHCPVVEAPYSSLPQEAVPSSQLIDLLRKLALDKRSIIAIVSGRAKVDLDQWFGDIDNIWLAAEHGAALRSPESRQWGEPAPGTSQVWKRRVHPVLEHFVERTPGSFIEEKEFSLVWHYRMADLEFGDWLANDLIANLEHMLADSPVKPVKGQRTLEVKSLWANKQLVCERFLAAGTQPEFILAAGDDATDEDLFAQVPSSAWTIHVGNERSRARYYLPGPNEMVELISQFADLVMPEESSRPESVGLCAA